MSAGKSTNEGTRRSQPLVTTSPRRTRFATALLAALLALTLALASRAEAYVYWTNPNDGSIGRANLDGTGVDNSFITDASNLTGLAVNSTHVYWVSNGAIGRANLDGTGVDTSFIADVFTAPGVLDGVAVDDAHVYWVSRFADDFAPGTGAIGRANLDGTGVDENFITGLNWPAGAVAVDGSHIYWTRISAFTVVEWPDRIGRANLDGTGVDEDFITVGVGRHQPGLAVGDSHVWWTSEFSIERANLDGTGTEFVLGGLAGDSGQDFLPAGAIAVDDTHFYWTGGYVPTPAGRIGRANLDGTRVNNDFITGPYAGQLAVEGLGPPPANQFSFAKLRKNRRKGTAKLTVKVPGQGELGLAKTKKVKADDEDAEAAGKEKLRIKPKGKAKKKLNRTGKAKVKAKVTYTPEGGESNTQSKKVKLIKR